MTESQRGVDPPFSKRPTQLAIATLAILVTGYQVTALLCLQPGYANRQTGTSRTGWEQPKPGKRSVFSEAAKPLIQIDINRAGARELVLLPGVGATLARRIIANRQRSGPFESVEAMARVRGIGRKTIFEIRSIAYVDPDPSGRP